MRLISARGSNLTGSIESSGWVVCDATAELPPPFDRASLDFNKDQVKPIRVLLVDDHTLVRAGIRALLGRHDGVEVVGEAAGGHEALRLIEELQPDIVLLD